MVHPPSCTCPECASVRAEDRADREWRALTRLSTMSPRDRRAARDYLFGKLVLGRGPAKTARHEPYQLPLPTRTEARAEARRYGR